VEVVGTGVSNTGSRGESNAVGGVMVGSSPRSETVGKSESSVRDGLSSSRGDRVESPPCSGFHCSAASLSVSRT